MASSVLHRPVDSATLSKRLNGFKAAIRVEDPVAFERSRAENGSASTAQLLNHIIRAVQAAGW